jgi:predicted Zn-ribbon and HTH transcriptional regulator
MPGSKIRTPANEIILRDMWAKKSDVQAIARAVNASSDSIHRWLHDLGLKHIESGSNLAGTKRPANDPERAPRKCLQCGAMFRSEWIGNRRCLGCKDRDEDDQAEVVLALDQAGRRQAEVVLALDPLSGRGEWVA